MLLTPARRTDAEHLDRADCDPFVRRRSHRDIQLSNAVFGGTRAVVSEIRQAFPELPQAATLLDVGTGAGDIPARASSEARAAGLSLTPIGLDHVPDLIVAARERLPLGVCADARELPFRDSSVDIVTCAQLLHHFSWEDARLLIREMHRVARVRVIISDLRRSWLAVAGLWLSSFPLGFHPVSRHDGVISILRGYTAQELRSLITEAIGVHPTLHARALFRYVVSWNPSRYDRLAPANPR